MTCLAVWSSEFTGLNGQALVTRRVVGHVLPKLGKYRAYIYKPSARLESLLSWIFVVGRLWIDFALGRVGAIYVVCSRSNMGFLRDLPALILTRFGLTAYVHVHGTDILELFSSRTWSSVARWAYRPCELVVPSHHLEVALSQFGFRAVHVSENFAAPGVVEASKDDPPTTGPLRVLWNSNILASKGILDTLVAYQSLLTEGEQIDLCILGSVIADQEMQEAEIQDSFTRLVEATGASYFGSVSNDVALGILKSADAVVLPSRYPSELQPLALIEAMCMGKAVVAADTPALRATLGEYPADFVPVRSADHVAQALRRFAREKDADARAFHAKRRSAAKLAQARFSVDRFDRQMVEILTGCNSRAQSAPTRGAPVAKGRAAVR